MKMGGILLCHISGPEHMISAIYVPTTHNPLAILRCRHMKFNRLMLRSRDMAKQYLTISIFVGSFKRKLNINFKKLPFAKQRYIRHLYLIWLPICNILFVYEANEVNCTLRNGYYL